MASAADYGSTFGFLVFAQELALLAYCLLRRDDGSDDGDAPQVAAENVGKRLGGDLDHLDDDTRFLFDIVARQDEGIVQNIDALDNGLIAVAVGVIAITLFAADKWFDLDPNFRFAGMFILCESAVVALLGYLVRYFPGRGDLDSAVFSDFATEFSESAVIATLSAITDTMRFGKANAAVRRYKRSFIAVATLLAVVAVAVIIAGRALGAVSSY